MSALEQYCEAVPRADGGRDKPPSSGTSGNQGTSSTGSGVNGATAKALSASGADGAAVNDLVTESARGSRDADDRSGWSRSTSEKPQQSSRTSEGVQVEEPKDPSGSPLKAATKAAEAGPVSGPALVWALVGLGGLGAVGAVVLRRRDRLAPPGDES